MKKNLSREDTQKSTMRVTNTITSITKIPECKKK